MSGILQAPAGAASMSIVTPAIPRAGLAGSVLDVVTFQATWFAAVLGAARGHPWLGLVAGAIAIGLHLLVSRQRTREAALVLGVAALGYAADSGLVLGGWLDFPPQARLGGPAAAWMVVLWAGLATNLRSSLAWMRGRFLLAAVAGAVAGPLSYLAGARLGAVLLPGDPPLALLAVAIEWALAMPALVLLAWGTAKEARP